MRLDRTKRFGKVTPPVRGAHFQQGQWYFDQDGNPLYDVEGKPWTPPEPPAAETDPAKTGNDGDPGGDPGSGQDGGAGKAGKQALDTSILPPELRDAKAGEIKAFVRDTTGKVPQSAVQALEAYAEWLKEQPPADQPPADQPPADQPPADQPTGEGGEAEKTPQEPPAAETDPASDETGPPA